MRDGVRNHTEPIIAGFNMLRNHPLSQTSYASTGTSSEIGRNPTIQSQEFDRDSNAAYQCALMSCITGDKRYAKVTIEILDAWSAVLRVVSGADAVLCAALGPFKMLNAAELMRHSDMGWPTENAKRFGKMMREVILPVIQNFAPFANGNWDTAAMKMMMAIAIYNDDRGLFERALTYYTHGCGNGQLAHYIYLSGECQESGRDQQHTQLGIGHMGDCCEMAWHQGLDLYSLLDSRLLLGFEYTARYCLGEEVSFQPDIDQTGKYRHEVISPRSNLRPVFEQIYNHYAHRKGLSAPWTQRAAEKLRPEGAGPGADQTGFGTLIYTRPPGPDIDETASVAIPSGLYARASEGAIQLDFVPLARPSRYAISRAENGSTAFTNIAKDLVVPVYHDHSVGPGRLYSYRVTASDSRRPSSPITEMASLPPGWLPLTAGLQSNGSASFDGIGYRLRAMGRPSLDGNISGFFVHCAVPATGTFTARIVPLIASQFLQLGIAMLNQATSPGPQVILSISPREQSERPAWSASLLRVGDGKVPLQSISSWPLGAPTITYGRLVQPLWLRLQLSRNTLRAVISSDGTTWEEIGTTEISAGSKRVGLFLNSGLEEVTTEVCFDQVSVTASESIANQKHS